MLVAAFATTIQAQRPAHPGWLGRKQCLEAIHRDTLPMPPGGWGEVDRLMAKRGEQRLLLDQDFELLGDTALRLAEPLREGEVFCLWTFEAPGFVTKPWLLHAEQDIPAMDSLARAAFLNSEDLLLPQETKGTTPLSSTLSGAQGSEYRLDFNGSKTMAVSVGDGGGLGLDATLRLEVKGQLASNVFVEGRLSDQNVPLQPEGNTATLKELDTKYIRLYGRQYDATLGDFELQHGKDGMDRLNARVAGVRGRFSPEGWSIHGALAQSQGLYRSDTLRGVDGKQRGYYLRAKDGRIFIRVMPGTERLWRNGQRLERGLDYTIDYAEGRIDFLNRLAISSENLFSAEYEYADEDYPRTLATLGVSDTLGHWIWGLRALRLSEDEDHPLGAASDSSLRSELAKAGDKSVSDSSSRPVRAPEAHSVEVAEWQWRPDSSHFSLGSVAATQRDLNLYSHRDDHDNEGFATHYEGRQQWGRPFDQRGAGGFDIAFLHDYRSEAYSAFNQAAEARSFRDRWNLSARTAENDFSANSAQLGYRPYTRLKVLGEAGYARGKAYGDTGDSVLGEAESRRLSLLGRIGEGRGGQSGLELSSEAKWARTPLQNTNYRQQGFWHGQWGRFSPQIDFDRNEWIQELPGGLANQALQLQPHAGMRWQTPWEPLSLESGIGQVQWQSRFGGRLPEVADSVRLLNVEQRASLSGFGAWYGEGFYRFQQHEAWSLDAQNRRSEAAQTDEYHLFEGQMRWSPTQKGLSLASSYKVERTAELPLVEDYDSVAAGQGQYVFDSSMQAYHAVETGGDYVLVGLMRDTTLGTRPYQDMQWTADFEIVPARFPFRVKGVLADLEFSGQIAADLQDSSADAPLFPLLYDAGIRAARSGRSRFQPQLRWRHPDGHKQLTAQVTREYSKTAGIYAALEKHVEVELIARRDWSEIWDFTLTGRWQSRDRRGGGAASGISLQEGQGLDGRLQRQFAAGVLGILALSYQQVSGEASAEPYQLIGWRPSLRLEKAFPERGRVFSEYSLQSWSGSGQGDYYALGGYSKGLTHRVESSADFELQTYLFLHVNYLLRFEPNRSGASQRMNAEMRAVF